MMDISIYIHGIMMGYDGYIHFFSIFDPVPSFEKPLRRDLPLIGNVLQAANAMPCHSGLRAFRDAKRLRKKKRTIKSPRKDAEKI